jgi:hypothetical protein
MQFSMLSIVAVLAATASAASMNGTSAYPTASGASKPNATGTSTLSKPTSSVPFTGGAAQVGGSALGMIVAGGVALVSSVQS